MKSLFFISPFWKGGASGIYLQFSEQALKLQFRCNKEPHPYRWGTLAELEDIEVIEKIEVIY